MIFIQPSSRSQTVECFKGGSFLVSKLTFDQVVVKPYDTVARELKLADAAAPNEVTLSTEGVNKVDESGAHSPELVICLSADIVATDSSDWRKTIVMARWRAEPDRRRIVTPYLIKRNTFWTSIDSDSNDNRSAIDMIELLTKTRPQFEKSRPEFKRQLKELQHELEKFHPQFEKKP